MAKKKSVQDSFRWPGAFSNPEACSLLADQPGWKLVVADLQALADSLQYKVVHQVPVSMEQVAQQNFERGQIAALERILEFEQELAEWKKARK